MGKLLSFSEWDISGLERIQGLLEKIITEQKCEYDEIDGILKELIQPLAKINPEIKKYIHIIDELKQSNKKIYYFRKNGMNIGIGIGLENYEPDLISRMFRQKYYRFHLIHQYYLF